MNYTTIKKNYDKGLWTAYMVGTCVRKGIITAAQYEQITGSSYEV